jgi:predicted HTH transcriptional regulator
LIEVLIIEHVAANPQIKQKEIIESSGKSKRSIQEGFARLQEKGILINKGSKMKPLWSVKESRPR